MLSKHQKGWIGVIVACLCLVSFAALAGVFPTPTGTGIPVVVANVPQPMAINGDAGFLLTSQGPSLAPVFAPPPTSVGIPLSNIDGSASGLCVVEGDGGAGSLYCGATLPASLVGNGLIPSQVDGAATGSCVVGGNGTAGGLTCETSATLTGSITSDASFVTQDSVTEQGGTGYTIQWQQSGSLPDNNWYTILADPRTGFLPIQLSIGQLISCSSIITLDDRSCLSDGGLAVDGGGTAIDAGSLNHIDTTVIMMGQGTYETDGSASPIQVYVSAQGGNPALQTSTASLAPLGNTVVSGCTACAGSTAGCTGSGTIPAGWNFRGEVSDGGILGQVQSGATSWPWVFHSNNTCIVSLGPT